MPDKRYAAVQRIVRTAPEGRIYQMQATSDEAKVVRWPLAKQSRRDDLPQGAFRKTKALNWSLLFHS